MAGFYWNWRLSVWLTGVHWIGFDAVGTGGVSEPNRQRQTTEPAASEDRTDSVSGSNRQ
jgi:hypothetical protein